MLGSDSLVSRPHSALDSQAGSGGYESSRLDSEDLKCARYDQRLYSLPESGGIMMKTLITSQSLTTSDQEVSSPDNDRNLTYGLETNLCCTSYY